MRLKIVLMWKMGANRDGQSSSLGRAAYIYDDFLLYVHFKV
jgi:hypothetical protein